MATPGQVRAARAVLRWEVRRLAKEAGVGVNTVSRFENGGRTIAESIRKMQLALESAGIEFLDHGKPGIRWPADREAS